MQAQPFDGHSYTRGTEMLVKLTEYQYYLLCMYILCKLIIVEQCACRCKGLGLWDEFIYIYMCTNREFRQSDYLQARLKENVCLHVQSPNGGARRGVRRVNMGPNPPSLRFETGF